MPRKQKNKSQAAKGARGNMRQIGQPPRNFLAPCTKKLVAVMADPIGAPAGACACMGVCQRSQKLKSVARGTFVVGTTTGFVLFTPGVGMTYDQDSIFVTGSGYAGSTFSGVTTGVTAQQVTMNPYSAAGLAGTSTTGSCRLVAAALRVRCIDTPLVAKGRQLSFIDPFHASIVGRNFDTLASKQGVSVQVVSALETSEVRWAPVDMDEYDFGAYTAIANSHMGVITSGAATGTSFEYELAVHYEVSGQVAPQWNSPSSMDPIGGPVLNDLLMGAPEVLQAPKIPARVLEVAVENKILNSVSLPHHIAGSGNAKFDESYAVRQHQSKPALIAQSYEDGRNFKYGTSERSVWDYVDEVAPHIPTIIDVISGLF